MKDVLESYKNIDLLMKFEKFYLDSFQLMKRMEKTFDLIIKYKDVEKRFLNSKLKDILDKTLENLKENDTYKDIKDQDKPLIGKKFFIYSKNL